jgi:hypothetical protein
MKLYSSNHSFKQFHFLETSESPVRTVGGQYPRCPIHGGRLLGPARPNTRLHANPAERLTQTSRTVRWTFSTHPDLVHGLSIPTKPQVAGIIFETRLTGSEAGGKLIHKLIRATQGTQVPWQMPRS